MTGKDRFTDSWLSSLKVRQGGVPGRAFSELLFALPFQLQIHTLNSLGSRILIKEEMMEAGTVM